MRRGGRKSHDHCNQRNRCGARVASQGPLLVGAGKLAVSGHIGGKNGCEFPGLRHGSPFTTRQSSTINRSGLWADLDIMARALILKKGYRDQDIAEIAREAAIAKGMSK
jgi:hypothetical protein